MELTVAGSLCPTKFLCPYRLSCSEELSVAY